MAASTTNFQEGIVSAPNKNKTTTTNTSNLQTQLSSKTSTFGAMLRDKLRASLQSFTHDVENNGIRAAIRRRSSPMMDRGGDPTDHQDDGHHYTLGDHMEYLHIHRSSQQTFYCDVSHLMTSDSALGDLVHDFVHPVPERQLEEMYFGLNELSYRHSNSNSSGKESSQNLPVRTMTMRLAPDVMSVVVLDAVLEACENQGANMTQVLKRLQGHLQCLLVPDDDTKLPFILDAMVITRKSGMLDRLLLLRVFYASGDSTSATSVPTKRQVAQQHRAQAIHNINNAATQVMIPINLQLRASAAFVQYLEKLQATPRFNEMEQPPLLLEKCPKPSPKACTAHFMGSYEPTISVQKQKELKQSPSQVMFPSLNSDDWSLLQSSWSVLLSVWRTLGIQRCLFHSFELPQSGPLVLDLHYCSQLRQLAREYMLVDIRNQLTEIEQTIERIQTRQARFAKLMDRAYQKYKLPPFTPLQKELPELRIKEPSTIPPPAYTQLAECVSQCVEPSAKPATTICDDVVTKVYKTFLSFDEHQSRTYLKDANDTVVERLVRVQELQEECLLKIERHPNGAAAAKLFGKHARLATNTKGRVHRGLLTRVPLVEFEILNGKCQITATSILCRKSNILLGRDQYNLFDLKAVDCIVTSANCMLIRGKAAPPEDLFQIQASTDLVTLAYVIKTLQQLQAVFEREPNGQEQSP